MNNPVDLNALVTQAATDAHDTLYEAQAAIASIAPAVADLRTATAKLSALIDTAQAILKAGITLEQDVDGAVKNFKVNVHVL